MGLDSITDSTDMNFAQTLRDSGGQRSLACCSSRGHKELDLVTEQLQQFLNDLRHS